jgi:LysM repeat protein
MAFGTTVNEVREINSKDIADINFKTMELNKSTLDEIKKGFTNLEKSVQKMNGGIRIPGLKSLTDMAK